MISEEAYFWRIQWAGTWMLTYRRFSEREIRREHPEAIRIEGSGETVLVPEEQLDSAQVHAAPQSRLDLYF